MTPSQLSILAAHIRANTDPAVVSALANGADNELARLYSLPAIPAVMAWRTDARVADILNAIDLSKYTPNDTADNTATYTNRALLAQTKQMNLQIMVQGRESINAALVTVRAGLRDAVIAVPTGAGGVSTSPGGAGGVNVLNACTRPALVVEMVFAATSQASDTTGTVTARVLTREGGITSDDVAAALRP